MEKMNTLDEMKPGCSTHVRLMSESVKNFNLQKTENDNWIFGFTLKKGWDAYIVGPDEDGLKEVSVYIGRDGLDALINFLNRCVEQMEEK